jgi:hypothetical protein
VARPSFITELALYLPAPIPNEANPDWLLDNIIEEGPAELLYQMTVPLGALPLNDERAQRCLERLESLRAMWQPKERSTEANETVQSPAATQLPPPVAGSNSSTLMP